MNDHVKNLFVAMFDNQVIASGTNVMDFYKSFKSATGYTKGYYTFRKLIKNERHYAATISGKEYFFQKVV